MALDALFRIPLWSRYTIEHHELHGTRSVQAVSLLWPTKASKKTQTEHTPPNETKTKANKNKQNNPGWSWACKPIQFFRMGYSLVYSEHFLCPDLKTSTTHCHKNTGNLSVSTPTSILSNFFNYSPELPTQIHFNSELRASEQIVTFPQAFMTHRSRHHTQKTSQ